MRTLSDRFWPKADRSGGDESCWPWQGATTGGGYGKIRIGTRTEGANRVAWALTSGPIPVGMHVLHSCDNPPCVNPRHLSLGTVADNMHDRDAKGRGRGGPNAPHKRVA